MIKERYEKAEIEFISFTMTDVLNASGSGEDDDDELPFVPAGKQ